MLNKPLIAASSLLFLWLSGVGFSSSSVLIKTALLELAVALGLGALLGWALNSLIEEKRRAKLEETWAARLRDKENELELTSSKLGSFLNALQINYKASLETIRAHEASLAECQSTRAELEASLAAWVAELDRTYEALRRETQDWETRYRAVTEAKEMEIGRLQSRVRELEQRQLRELERQRSQTRHWKFSVLLQERETATAKLTPLHFRP